MTLAEIAAELGFDLKTIERDCRSIAGSFRAAGIDLARLNAADTKFVAAVIVYTLQEKCRVSPDRPDSVAEMTPRAPMPSFSGDVAPRAGLPPRFRSKP